MRSSGSGICRKSNIRNVLKYLTYTEPAARIETSPTRIQTSARSLLPGTNRKAALGHSWLSALIILRRATASAAPILLLRATLSWKPTERRVDDEL